MERWTGKVAVVTGASSGIGAGIARKLVENGLQVVGLARRLDAMQKLALETANLSGKLHPIKTDVRNSTEVGEAFEWIENNFGTVDILINNAAVLLPDNILTGKPEDWQATLDTNIFGVSIVTREALPRMRHTGGHIINMNSISGHRYYNILSMYCATKQAMTALNAMVRLELKKRDSKIKLTSLSPGFVDTPLLEGHGDVFNFPAITVDDVVDSCMYVLSTPPHICIEELIINHVNGA